MIAFFETTIGKVILVGIVVLVWGVNAFNFSSMSEGDDAIISQQPRTIDMADMVVPDRVMYEYTSSKRDPFSLNTQRVPVAQPTINQDIPEPTFEWPRLSLAGVFDGTAVISDERGQSYFLKKGESFRDNITVKEIVKDSVILEYRQKELILKLN